MKLFDSFSRKVVKAYCIKLGKPKSLDEKPDIAMLAIARKVNNVARLSSACYCYLKTLGIRDAIPMTVAAPHPSVQHLARRDLDTPVTDLVTTATSLDSSIPSSIAQPGHLVARDVSSSSGSSSTTVASTTTEGTSTVAGYGPPTVAYAVTTTTTTSISTT